MVGKNSNNMIEIHDFKSRVDRILYILEVSKSGEGYAVVNSDPNNPNEKIVRGRTRRDILVVKLMNKDWKNSIQEGKSIEYRGFGKAETIFKSGYFGLNIVEGTIYRNNKNSYTTENEQPIAIEDKQAIDIIAYFDDNILNTLEHFLVPQTIASNIRYFKYSLLNDSHLNYSAIRE